MYDTNRTFKNFKSYIRENRLTLEIIIYIFFINRFFIYLDGFHHFLLLYILYIRIFSNNLYNITYITNKILKNGYDDFINFKVIKVQDFEKIFRKFYYISIISKNNIKEIGAIIDSLSDGLYVNTHMRFPEEGVFILLPNRALSYLLWVINKSTDQPIDFFSNDGFLQLNQLTIKNSKDQFYKSLSLLQNFAYINEPNLAYQIHNRQTFECYYNLKWYNRFYSLFPFLS